MSKHKDMLSHMIYLEALGDRDIKVSMLAKALDLPLSNIWFSMHGHRKWNVDSWILVLNALGVINVTKDTITIKSKIGAQALRQKLLRKLELRK